MRAFCSGFVRSVVSSACLLATPIVGGQGSKAGLSSTGPRPEHGPALSGEQVVLPLVVVKGYPFIQGSINGHAGDLMFDTGMQPSLIVNRLAIDTPDVIKIGRGAASSGQAFDTFLYPLIEDVSLPGDLHFKHSTDILGIPADFIQKGVDARYIGSLGDDFFAGYVVKLDYVGRSVTFYRNDAAQTGEAKAEAGETVVQTIPFENAGHRNSPTFSAELAGAPVTIHLDTSAHVSLSLTKRQMAAMVKRGALQKQGHDDYLLSGLVINGQRSAPFHTDVAVQSEPKANNPAKPAADLTFGYEFLRQFRTVWNYERSTLTLLRLQ